MRARTLAGLGATLVAPALALPGPAVAGAAASAPAAAQRAAAPAAPAVPADDATAQSHCSSHDDYRLQLSARLYNVVTGAASNDQVQLYYSPGSRCVYGKFLGASPCNNSTGRSCSALLTRHNGTGVPPTQLSCSPSPSGPGYCVTGRLHDDGTVAAVEGEVGTPSQLWRGKTGWW